jgi:integrase
VIGARWDEIDFQKKIWSVPPERAETKISVDEPRRVPLSDRAIEILKALPTEEGNEHLFIGGKAGRGLASSTKPKQPRRRHGRTARNVNALSH